MNTKMPIAVLALEAAPRAKPSNYPEPFKSMMTGRVKRPLGDLFGLSNFGVNLTTVPAGALSALRHAHSKQDEFVYIVSGTLTLHTDEGATQLSTGMCAGFKAGKGNAHHLVNEGSEPAVYLEVGDRTPGDSVAYPDDDLVAKLAASGWVFEHKDGTPYA
ncbi:MAG: cupin domain-containing protein [Paucibacter sp.]|nr:cupin domain-containing protein [Roseateles sp.]